MANTYNQITNTGSETHFSHALFGEVQTSRMIATPVHLTTFNAGNLVPIYCKEVLPDDVFSVDCDFVIRQTTLLTPTMGNMQVDLYAFFVPNRIVNQSWKAVMGENYNGSWTANSVSLAPLWTKSTDSVRIPIGSVADYYGFPTQQAIPGSVLSLCNDLKFRGYVMIWNEFFRDQNYQPPIAMSTLNVYEGFLENRDLPIPMDGVMDNDLVTSFDDNQSADGSFGAGALAHSIYGSGQAYSGITAVRPLTPSNVFKAYEAPLKVNKLHDYFTSVLPSTQKGAPVFVPVVGALSGRIPVVTSSTTIVQTQPLQWYNINGGNVRGTLKVASGVSTNSTTVDPDTVSGQGSLAPSNLVALANNATVSGLEVSVNDLRMASAIQQVYETLARGGSRYREYVRSFFGLEVEDPFSDIPQYLGHIRRNLDLYQTAQTSASSDGSTPQGNLSAFGYTSSNGHLFSQRFVEHGYIHIFACVRQKNIYPSFMERDNFRLNMLDFYQPPLANISEQPVYTREINPFSPNPNNAFGYQEAWAEYRFEPDRVSGYMRPGIDNSLSLWNYSDEFSSSLQIADGFWLQSNAQEVLDRTLAVTSAVAPQFKGQFKFIVDKTRPMPTYSVPGLDII